MFMASVASIALPAYAQPDGPGRHVVAIQGFGNFVTTTTQDRTDNTATNSGGVVGGYGAGADFKLSSHIFMRAEYRGLVYNSPTYDLPALAGVGRVAHRAMPSVGFGYRL